MGWQDLRLAAWLGLLLLPEPGSETVRLERGVLRYDPEMAPEGRARKAIALMAAEARDGALPPREGPDKPQGERPSD